MTAARLLLVPPLAALLLTACGVDPAAERRELVLGITEAANSGDEDAVRAHAASLLELVDRQVADEELPAEEADRLRALVAKVEGGADVLDEELQAQRAAEAEAARAKAEADEARRQLEEARAEAEERGRDEEGGDKGEGKDKGDKDD